MRKVLPSKTKTEYILADDLSIAFNASAEYWLDAARLEKLSETASSDESMAVLSEYQGELLPGFYDEWVVLEREHLNSIFENKMARLMSLLQDENRWLDILDWAERWIKLGQKPEPAPPLYPAARTCSNAASPRRTATAKRPSSRASPEHRRATAPNSPNANPPRPLPRPRWKTCPMPPSPSNQ
jgi:hypothetical protein